MANMFDENGNYNKTEWKPGDRITAGKLNKIEESLEAINNNDIERHKEADERLDALEEQNEAVEERFDELEDLVADNKSEVEVLIYENNVKMDSLEQEMNERIDEVHAVAETVDGKIDKAEADMDAAVAEVYAVAETVDGKIAAADASMKAQVNQGKADMEAMVDDVESSLEIIDNHISRVEDIYVDVTKFGAKGDGVTDDTNAIKLAIAHCSANVCGTVFLPPGNYVITDSLTLPWGVNLRGMYEKTTIRPKFNTGYALKLQGRHCIENFRFFYEDNDPATTTTPKEFPAAIYSDNLSYSVIRNIGLGNAYVGMHLQRINGSCTIENIYGWPLSIGIYVDHCIDVLSVNRFHFNSNYYGVTKLELRQFVFKNGIAMKIGRIDFGKIDKIFAWGYKTLIMLDSSTVTGSGNNLKFTNWMADACQSFCDFKHHDGGISFINGTGTFYNPYKDEEIENGMTPTTIGTYVATVRGGVVNNTSSNVVSFINNRIYKCDYHFLRVQNPIIFIGNEITNYANSYTEDGTAVIDCLALEAGSDRSIIQNNYIDGKKKCNNRNISLNNVSDVIVMGNILLGYKAASVYKNTETNTIVSNVTKP